MTLVAAVKLIKKKTLHYNLMSCIRVQWHHKRDPYGKSQSNEINEESKNVILTYNPWSL